MNRHFILTSPRSGSNFLTATINKHPRLLNYGEVLGEWTLPRKVISRRLYPRKTDEEYLDLLYRSRTVFYGGQIFSAARKARRGRDFILKRRSQVASLGLKDMAALVREGGLSRYFERSHDLKVIHLLRTNTLKRFVSFERMRKTNVVSTEGQEPRVLVDLDLDGLLGNLQTFQSEDAFATELSGRLPPERVVIVRYEEYFFDVQGMRETNAALFTFLGADPRDIAADQRKISPDCLGDIVNNYTDVCRTLAGTKFERFLD